MEVEGVKVYSLRRCFIFFCSLFIFSLNISVKAASLPNLEELESYINNSPEVLSAEMNYLRNESLLRAEEARNGTKYFLGANYGYFHEPLFETSPNKDTYQKLNLNGGLVFPLLGSKNKERIREIQAEIDVVGTKLQKENAKVSQLTDLRKAYVILWAAQEKTALAEQFLATEKTVQSVLQDRQKSGLLLPADELELLAVYADARRDIAFSRLMNVRALQMINLVTGQEWSVEGKVISPLLPALDVKTIEVQKYPEVLYQKELIEKYQELVEKSGGNNQDVDLTVGFQSSKDFPGDTGNGAYAALTWRGAIEGLKAKENYDAKVASYELEKAKEEARLNYLKLVGKIEESVENVNYLQTNIEAKKAHLLVAAEDIRERLLRHQFLPGDTFERLQQAKSQYYRLAMEVIDEEASLLEAAIDVLEYTYPSGNQEKERTFSIGENEFLRNSLFSESWENTETLFPFGYKDLNTKEMMPLSVDVVQSIEKNTENPQTTKKNIVINQMERKIPWGVYIWNADALLNEKQRSQTLQDLINAGFSDVLLSFTGEQIRYIVSEKGQAELESLLDEAKKSHLKVSLLLGDPNWAKHENKGELIHAIQQLERFDFVGVHLDIEPDSLSEAKENRIDLFNQLIDNLHDVKKITKKPLSISIHPRYLEGELGEIAKERLPQIELEKVVVMLYSSKTDQTMKRMKEIIESQPNLNIALAQSVEHSISSEESYAYHTQQDFFQAMQSLENGLAVDEIFIQAWEDYKEDVK